MSEKLLSHSSEEFCRGTLLCSKKICYRNFSGIRILGGYHVFSLKLLYLAIPNLLVEELFCVSETLGYRIFLCLRAENNDFPKKLFCVQVPTNFVGQLFCVSRSFWYRKKIMEKMRGGKDYHDFPKKEFMSLSFETFYWYNL